MPYKKSKARKEFEQSLEELFSLARSISYQKIKLSYDHKNLIYQSSIVLLSSAIEEYLRVFVEDLFYSYKINNSTLSQIHRNSRSFSLFSNQRAFYEAFVHTRDEPKILDKLDIKNFCFSVINDHETFVNQIDAKKIVFDRKYPSVKNIKILYNRLGIKNIFSVINNKGGKDFGFILTSFLDIREMIAHQESTDLTFTDVKRNFIYINEFINQLDRVAFGMVCSTSGNSFWI